MDEMAKNIIKDHKNPLTKVNLIGPKLFFKDSSSEAQDFVQKNLESLQNALGHGKVDKRCARAKAEWDSSLHLAKVDKVVKGLLENYGYQDKNGIYMYPEEMLYLIETNRLEVFINNVPLSIQECYDIVLNSLEMNLRKYRIYKKLVVQGYRLVRYNEMIRRRNKIKNKETSKRLVQIKRKFDDSKATSLENKKLLIQDGNTDKLERTKRCIEGIFDKLRENGPQQYIPECTEDLNPEYCVFSSTNTSRMDWDYNLYICETYAVDLLKFSSTKPVMYAICNGDNISLYKLGAVNLPRLQD